MSFGWSGSDVFLLAQLARDAVQSARKACGEHDELTRETVRLHAVLQRLAREVAKGGESPINRPGGTAREQLERIAGDCEVVLKQFDRIVTAYASLGEEKGGARKIWQRVRFGNGQRAELGDLRSKLVAYTSEMLLYLNLVSMSTVGRIEQRMNRDEGILRDIKVAVEKKTAHAVLGANQEGAVWTTYTSDDAGFWRGLRRDLVKDGLPSAAIHKHKRLIKQYVEELGARGILDEPPSIENYRQQQEVCVDSEIAEKVEDLPDDCDAHLNTPWKHDRNVGVEPLGDVNEQYLSDPTTPAPAKGIDVSFAVVSDVESDNDSSSESTSSIVDSRGDLDSYDTFPSRNEEHRSATYQHEPERPVFPGNSSESPNNKAYVGAPSSLRGEVQRSATYQPSPKVKYPSLWRSKTKPVDGMRLKNPSPRFKHPSIRRSETKPVDGMGLRTPVPLTSSNLNMKAPSDTTDSSSEDEYDTSEVDNAPFKFVDIWICPNPGSKQNESISCRKPRGSSPEDQLYDLTYEYYFKYARQCIDFQHDRFGIAYERKKIRQKLFEATREYKFRLDAVSVEDGVLTDKKERLIDDAIRKLWGLYWSRLIVGDT